MANSSKMSPEDYWSLRPFAHRTARKKWEFLQVVGYLLESTNEYGIVFKRRNGPERGFIDWWGKVTWEDE